MSTSIDSLLTQFRTVQPGAPRLTYYGTSGERIELSGKVLDNWVAKTANFLTEEFDFAPGSVLTLALPAHWKSLCLGLAALACGGTVSDSAAAAGTSAVLASAERELVAVHPGPLIAVELAALALRWEGALPGAARDYAAEVRMFADAFDRFEEIDDGEPALALTGFRAAPSPVAGQSPVLRIDYRELTEARLTELAAAYPPGSRIALSAEAGLAEVLIAALACWLRGGSVVLFETESLITADLLASEQVSSAQ